MSYVNVCYGEINDHPEKCSISIFNNFIIRTFGLDALLKVILCIMNTL